MNKNPLLGQWETNPEPHKKEMAPDPRSIIDTDIKQHDAYMWESHNCTQAWIEFTGNLLTIKQ